MRGRKVVAERAQQPAREAVPDQHLVQIALQVLTLVTIQELHQAAFQVAHQAAHRAAHRAPLVVTRAELVEPAHRAAVYKATEPETSKTRICSAGAAQVAPA